MFWIYLLIRAIMWTSVYWRTHNGRDLSLLYNTIQDAKLGENFNFIKCFTSFSLNFFRLLTCLHPRSRAFASYNGPNRNYRQQIIDYADVSMGCWISESVSMGPSLRQDLPGTLQRHRPAGWLVGHKNISTTRMYLRKSSPEQRNLINQIVN